LPALKLEEEIKQKKFANEYHKAVVNIIYTGNCINNIQLRFLKAFGISGQQFNILRILRGQHSKPVTINILMERMLDKMSNASRLVEKLRLKGLVERKISSGDRRAVDVVITPKGLDLLAELDKEPHLGLEMTFNISVTEAEQLNRILDKMRG
jgi:DNA-binding MarR family transcriptional regulator